MIVVFALGVLTVLHRLWTRRFTAGEWMLLLLVLGNFAVLAAQLAVCDHYFPPENRYWYQSGVLMCGWAVWGVDALSQALGTRWRPARLLLPALVGVFAAIDVAMLVKPHVPGSRRNAYVRACDWAVGRIREDWRGPAADPADVFSIREYHTAKRPVVCAHVARVPYLLDGRTPAHSFGKADLPDYIFDETGKVVLPKGHRYDLIDKVRFGRREFSLLRLRR